jgi:hypothetical protein
MVHRIPSKIENDYPKILAFLLHIFLENFHKLSSYQMVHLLEIQDNGIGNNQHTILLCYMNGDRMKSK